MGWGDPAHYRKTRGRTDFPPAALQTLQPLSPVGSLCDELLFPCAAFQDANLSDVLMDRATMVEVSGRGVAFSQYAQA